MNIIFLFYLFCFITRTVCACVETHQWLTNGEYFFPSEKPLEEKDRRVERWRFISVVNPSYGWNIVKCKFLWAMFIRYPWQWPAGRRICIIPLLAILMVLFYCRNYFFKLKHARSVVIVCAMHIVHSEARAGPLNKL